MVGVRVSRGSDAVRIIGSGVVLDERFEVAHGIYLDPFVPPLDLQQAADGAGNFSDYAAVLYGNEKATFSVHVLHSGQEEELAAKGWNALWVFPLLSLACAAPCNSLYALSGGDIPSFTSANRDIFFAEKAPPVAATPAQLEWAKEHYGAFGKMIHDPLFSAAIRCYGNAHRLHDTDLRIMLLWSGIEGLLSVDAELSRRLALYACLMFKGDQSEKEAYYKLVKKAYGVRSKAVHGGRPKPKALADGYGKATSILCQLLVRCVELGRVPSAEELDALAVSSTVT